MYSKSNPFSSSYKDGPELTPKLQQTADLLKQGKWNREIAQIMNISPKTVEMYLAILGEKLGTDNTRQLIIKLVKCPG